MNGARIAIFLPVVPGPQNLPVGRICGFNLTLVKFAKFLREQILLGSLRPPAFPCAHYHLVRREEEELPVKMVAS